jgi:hypothetical protein
MINGNEEDNYVYPFYFNMFMTSPEYQQIYIHKDTFQVLL